jgi:ABC-type antimicrobial peptide transport system permease subunit
VHVRGAPGTLAERVRTIATAVDPALRVNDTMPLDEVGADQWLESQFLSRLLVGLGGITLLLSLMAIYAVMAFTVVQRTREIGTRVALGAGGRQIVTAIVRRPLAQIGFGIGAGSVLVAMLFVGMFKSTPTPLEAGLLAAYASVMLGVCLSACAVPTWRALRLEPGQVLRG